jgi:hypothetical protein
MTTTYQTLHFDSIVLTPRNATTFTFMYNQTVFAMDRLGDTTHTLILMMSPGTGSTKDGSGDLALFDYAVYTDSLIAIMLLNTTHLRENNSTLSSSMPPP